MYFISKGKFSVSVKTDHLNPNPLLDESQKDQKDQVLVDGAHFGEIGMLFECKRTATVKSENYGTLALLQRSHFLELQKTFENFSSEFKKQIFKYEDELTTWLFMEMDKIDYFRPLSLETK